MIIALEYEESDPADLNESSKPVKLEKSKTSLGSASTSASQRLPTSSWTRLHKTESEQ